MASKDVVIKCDSQILDYFQLEKWQKMINGQRRVNVWFDLASVKKMTTAAFAKLLAIKIDLMRTGGNLQVRGLQGQPRALCRILKLCEVTEGVTINRT